jgi:Predicted permease, DMT superfamily
LTTAGNVILIQYAAPVYVALFGFSFLGERSTKIDWLAILIILIGLGCFFLEELSFGELWGNILALLSGFGFAGLTLFMRKQKNDRPIDSVLVGNLITFLLCSPFYFNNLTNDQASWGLISFLGIIQLGLAYILYSTAIKHVSALDAIIYPVIEPLFNPMLAFVFLGEAMSGTAFLGGGLVLLGVVGRGILKEMIIKKTPL